jgi:hypothetical protein
MGASKNPLKAVESLGSRLQSLRKARSTEYLVRMFGDTLPAEKSIAFRTAGHCLAKHMIKTALVGEVRHSSIIFYYGCNKLWCLLKLKAECYN